MSNIAICSLNYSPGLEKEILLLGDYISRKTQKEVTYLADPRYARIRTLKSSYILKIDTVIFYNISLKLLLYIPLRRMLGLRNLLCVHEPKKESLIKSYGIKTATLVRMRELVTHILMLSANELIVFSPYAHRITVKNLGFKKKTRQLSLYRLPVTERRPRKDQVLFVGQINATKKPKLILELANREDFQNLQFVILSNCFYKPDETIKNVCIEQRSPLTDKTILKFIQESKAVIIEHPQITQSGVFADCVAARTPVIYNGQTGIEQYASTVYCFDLSKKSVEELIEWLSNLNQTQVESKLDELFEKEFSYQAFCSHWE